MLKNIKVYVGKHSKETQEKAFALGWEWRLGEKIINKSYPFLYFTTCKTIVGGNNIERFNDDDDGFQEITAEEILAMEVPKPKKTIRDLYPLSGFRVMEDSRITEVNNISPHHSYELWNTLPTQEEAEAYKILPMLLQFRDRYNEGWKPDWGDKEKIYIIRKYVSPTNFYPLNCLYFKTAEIRDKFTEDFKEELEIVKYLL